MQYRNLLERANNYEERSEKTTFNHNEFRLREFLDDYGKALSKGDVDRIASMWSYPALIVGEQLSMAVTSQKHIRNFFSQAKEQYDRQGITHTQPIVEGLEWPTAHVALVWVRWPYVMDNNQAPYHESAVYTLKCDDSGEVKILQAIIKGSEADKFEDIWN